MLRSFVFNTKHAQLHRMLKKSIDDLAPPADPAVNVPSFTQGVHALVKCITDFLPRMDRMSNLVLDQLETTLHSDLLADPLGNLPPVVREALLHLPNVAWPTVILFLGNLFVMLSIVILSEFGWFSCIAACLLLTCCMFVMFTVAHDAAHGSISSDSKWLNGVIGRISFGCIGPLGCFAPWKWLHHRHHKFTNHPSKDPDRFISGGSGALAPLRSSVLIFYLLGFYVSHAASRPFVEILELLGHVIINSMLIAKAIDHGLWAQLLCYWVIPSLLAFTLLALFFDYIPHHDNDSTPIESRFHTTTLLKTYPILQPILTLLLQYQDYHLIHHLYPTIPFYKYVDKWQEKQDFLLEKNVKIHDLTLHLD
jgi:fatty acid desaturase